jgi:hypothetical protein
MAGDHQHDEIGAARLERVVGEEAARREVGEEEPGVLARRRDQRLGDLLALGAGEIDLDRALAFVEPGPEQALAVLVDRPARRVEAAADRIRSPESTPAMGSLSA